MFRPVKEKIDQLLTEGYRTRYENSQLVWERLRAGESVLFKLEKSGEVVKQIFAQPAKIGVYFKEIPKDEDYCRFHEEPLDNS